VRYLLVLLLCSCDAVERTEVEVWPVDGVGGSIRAVSIDVGVGHVTVRAVEAGPEGGAVRATRRVSGPSGGVSVDDDRFGGTLLLRSECALLATCRVDMEVEVPAGTALTLRVGSGDVWLDGAIGDVQVDVGDGTVRAELAGQGRRGVRMGWGDVDLQLATVPTGVAVNVAHGDVTVGVPEGVYRLDLEGFAGVERTGVEEGEGPVVQVQTRSGRVRLSGGAGP
jgi:hypothetical protein